MLTVPSGLQYHLIDDDLLAVFREECTTHLKTLRVAATGNRARDEVKLARATCDLERLVDALIDGVPAERVKDRMATRDAKKAMLEARAAAAPQ